MGRHRLARLDPDEGRVPREFCVCGHFEADHRHEVVRGHFTMLPREWCIGRVGHERCTCHGYREAWRSIERRQRWAQYRATGGAW
jgi:hypothetical protein